MRLNPQYLLDGDGTPVAVVLDLDTYTRLGDTVDLPAAADSGVTNNILPARPAGPDLQEMLDNLKFGAPPIDQACRILVAIDDPKDYS